MANEAIVSTALFYYDCDNISESLIAFRQHVECGIDIGYEQNDFCAVEEIYGFENEGPTVQDLGKVVRTYQNDSFPTDAPSGVASSSYTLAKKKIHP